MLITVEIPQSSSDRRSTVGAQGAGRRRKAGLVQAGQGGRKRAMLGQVGQHQACPARDTVGMAGCPFSHTMLSGMWSSFQPDCPQPC